MELDSHRHINKIIRLAGSFGEMAEHREARANTSCCGEGRGGGGNAGACTHDTLQVLETFEACASLVFNQQPAEAGRRAQTQDAL